MKLKKNIEKMFKSWYNINLKTSLLMQRSHSIYIFSCMYVVGLWVVVVH